MKKIELYFLRWYFPYNIGDTVMFSSLFRAIKEVYGPCKLEVISDRTVLEAFFNDRYVDRFRTPRLYEKILPKSFYYKKKNIVHDQGARRIKFVIWPEWREETFAYLSAGTNIEECVGAPCKNIISYNYALQAGIEAAGFQDLRPRIYLTEEEVREAEESIYPNSIAINMARIRNSQQRRDGERLRYRIESWRRFVGDVKKYDPSIRIYEVGQEAFEGVGDEFLPNLSIRKTAAALNAMRLVVLSDGGVHNICNAIDKKVLLFQAYEWNPPDLFKMGNAIFNEDYHLECRKRCHLFSDILKIRSAKETCGRECYGLDPARLARDCIAHLEMENRV